MANSTLPPRESGAAHPSATGRKLSPGPGLSAEEVAAHQLIRIHRAVIEIIAENGYKDLKIRDVVRRAEVSTRAFYEHFGGKEDCFLHTYDRIARRATHRIIAAQTGERDWRERAGCIFDQFILELEKEPDAAGLALIEAYRAGDAPLEHAWRAERTFEEMLSECLARAPGGVVVPPMVIEGMVAGIAGVIRKRLASPRATKLRQSRDELIDWALRYVDKAAMELPELDRRSVWRDTTLEPPAVPSTNGASVLRRPTGDRALILKAAATLAAEGGYAGLTAERIRSKAHVSRKKFYANFDGVEDCYIVAFEQSTAEAVAQAVRAQTAARSWSGGIYRAIVAYCRYVMGDPFLANICRSNDFPPGSVGSRARARAVQAVVEQLLESVPRSSSPTRLHLEASTQASWSLFHHHLLRARSLRPEIAATLTYTCLAPTVGPAATVEAIREEQ